MIKIIACIGKNRELGKNNELVFHLKKDMSNFSTLTKNHIVAMGRKTLESLPGSKPLKNRTNIVLASTGFERDDCQVFHSFDTILTIIQKYSYLDDADVYIIGGAKFYEAMLSYADELILTEVDQEAEADVYFPEYKDQFKLVDYDDEEENGIRFRFAYYERKK